MNVRRPFDEHVVVEVEMDGGLNGIELTMSGVDVHQRFVDIGKQERIRIAVAAGAPSVAVADGWL
jgi:hypothetical protein